MVAAYAKIVEIIELKKLTSKVFKKVIYRVMYDRINKGNFILTTILTLTKKRKLF